MCPLLSDSALLARLVGFDSTSQASNLPMAGFLADYLDRPGIRVSRNLSADGAKANLVILAGPDAIDRDGLLLSGHMDVVPALEPEWTTDPFVLTTQEDRLVGRGSADMKGFLALAANRMASVDLSTLRHPFALLLTYDEEVGTLGARRFTETWPASDQLPRSTVIGEPTSLRVVRAHKGMLRVRFAFEGRAAHSGYPHLGRSAIEPAARAIIALADLRRAMELEFPPHGELFPEVPFAALNVGTVNGGSAANVIPDRCVIEVSVRLLPGMQVEAVLERLRGSVRAAVGGEFSLERLSESPAMMSEAGAPIHQDLCAAVGQRESCGAAFATDGGWLQRAGFECVLFGPGSIEVAHRPNEFLPLDQFQRAGGTLDGLIRRRCVGA